MDNNKFYMVIEDWVEGEQRPLPSKYIYNLKDLREYIGKDVIIYDLKEVPEIYSRVWDDELIKEMMIDEIEERGYWYDREISWDIEGLREAMKTEGIEDVAEGLRLDLDMPSGANELIIKYLRLIK